MQQAGIQQTFQLAMQHHRAGRLREAEQIYGQILLEEPRHVNALHLLGVLAFQAGRPDVAIQRIREAISHQPQFPEAYSNLGNALQATGQRDEAIAAYRKAISLKPEFHDAHCNLGTILKDAGRCEEAVACLRKAIALKGNFPEAHYNLGAALAGLGRTEEAAAAYQRAIEQRPAFPEAHYNLGNALKKAGRWDEAIGAYRKALAIQPGYFECLSNLGVVLTRANQLEDAIAALRHAISLRPAAAEPHYNLAVALREAGRIEEAIAAYRQAIALAPDFCEAFSNLGVVLTCEGRLDEAIAILRLAVSIEPNAADVRYNLAFALWLKGELLEGWKQDERQWTCTKGVPPRRIFPLPEWDGQALPRGTILLHAEQGFGDAIHFIRYLPQVRQRVGHVVIECHPELRRLLSQMAPDLPVGGRGEAIPPADVHLALQSLPRIFETTLETIPQNVPYLRADPAAVEAWRGRVAGCPGGVRVGLLWAGNPSHTNDRNRSAALSHMAPLGEVAGVTFFSLQKGPAAAQVQTPPAGMTLIDLTAELKDFADTAALIANLDLVITPDTAVAHLAGAMGKVVWSLIPFAPDWRWLLDREDTPWYPTMRLFRQKKRGDWGEVVARVKESLRDFRA